MWNLELSTEKNIILDELSNFNQKGLRIPEAKQMKDKREKTRAILLYSSNEKKTFSRVIKTKTQY